MSTAARRIEPTRLLCDPNKETRLAYVPAVETDLRAKWASWFDYHARPENDESYAADQMADANEPKIPGNY